MTASAETLHNDLHIDFIDGSCTDINTLFVFCQYKRSLDTDNVQQFICGLSTDYSRAFQILTRTAADRIILLKYFCVANRFCSRLIGTHVIPEHLADTRHICSASA